MRAAVLNRLVPAAWTRRVRRLRRLLGRRVRFQRTGLDVQIVLEPIAPPTPAPAARSNVPPPPNATDVAWMLDDLTELLDSHPSARSVFPALVLVERALERRGGRALERLPGTLRQTTIALLDRLDSAGMRPGLELLRERLCALEPTMPRRPAGPAVQVEEASLTVFMEADRAWDQQWQHAAGTPPAVPERGEPPSAGAGR